MFLIKLTFVENIIENRKENGLSDFTNINKTINPVFFVKRLYLY